MRTLLLTAVALVAFAANSVLCRLALGSGSIDAASFTSVRISAGALALGLLLLWPRGAGGGERPGGSWPSALALCLYAVAFSFAYLSLPAGTGALILFGAVQATMILVGLVQGERPRPLEWIGLLCALGGLAYLMAPGVRAPSPLGSLLMAAAGIAWGAYSLRGRRSRRPVADTAGNFLRAVPLALLASAATLRLAHAGWRGIALAALSGAVTSGLGYVVWYAALRGLTATRAAAAQLAVPVIAAAAGVALLGEPVTARLVWAAVLILGGVGMVLWGRVAALPVAPTQAATAPR